MTSGTIKAVVLAALVAVTLFLLTPPLAHAHGELLCNYPEDSQGWLHCIDTSDGTYWDCMPIGGGQPFCIAHQAWHDDHVD